MSEKAIELAMFLAPVGWIVSRSGLRNLMPSIENQPKTMMPGRVFERPGCTKLSQLLLRSLSSAHVAVTPNPRKGLMVGNGHHKLSQVVIFCRDRSSLT